MQELRCRSTVGGAVSATIDTPVQSEVRGFGRVRLGLRIAPAGGMAGFKDFREIAAWQLAHELKLLADAVLERPAVARQFRFRDQLSDAARSGPRNIAEGFARFRHKEFAQFVRIAKGSEAEVLNHLIDARDLRLITDEEFLRAEHLARRALKAANGLIRFLESTPDPPVPPYKPKPRKAP